MAAPSEPTQVELSNPGPSFKCLQCPFWGPQSAFPPNSNLKYLKTCVACLEKMAGRRIQATGDKENDSKKQSKVNKGSRARMDRPPTLSWDVFISLLKNNKDKACELYAFIIEPPCIPLVPQKDCHDRVAVVAKAVWDATGFRFK
jgi:hypothetical protein